MSPKNERWVICPICKRANTPGKLFCQYCWGALPPPERSVSSQEAQGILKRWLSHLKRKKIIKLITITLVPIIILVSAVFTSSYYLSALIFKPPQDLNSNSLPGEWAMFRHDLGRSGSTNPSDILPQGTLKWVFPTGGPIHSSPAVVNNTVYIGSRDGKLYALDAATGVKRWEYQTESWVESSPAIVNGVVYIGSNDGRLYALDAHSGEKLWDFKTKYTIESSPAVAYGIVYFGAGDFSIYALDAAKGTKLWNSKTNDNIKSSPVVANGIVYVGSWDRSSYALHALTGKFRLNFKLYQPVPSSPAVRDGIVYVVNYNGFLVAIDGNARNWPWEYDIKPYWLQLKAFGLPVPTPPIQSGFLWGSRLEAIANSSPAVTDDTLYIGSNNKLFAIDIHSHEERWTFEAEGAISSSPAVAHTTVYVGSEDSRLYALDTTTGEKLWEIVTGGKITSSPAVADATVYIGSHDGNVYAIE